MTLTEVKIGKENWMKRFLDPGKFSEGQLGILPYKLPNKRSPIPVVSISKKETMVLPTPEFLETLSYITGDVFRYIPDLGLIIFTDPQSENTNPFLQRLPGKDFLEIYHMKAAGMDQKKIDSLANDLDNISWAAVEGSFIDHNYSDKLLYGRYIPLLHIYDWWANDVMGYGHLWELGSGMKDINSFRRLAAIDNFALSHPQLTKFTNNLLGLKSGTFESSFLESINIVGQVMNQMLKGDYKPGQLLFKHGFGEENFHMIIEIAASYMFALLKSGVGQKHFSKEQLKQFSVALAKAECAPDQLKPTFPVYQERFSTYLNLVTDMTVRELAPLSFAFANRAMLEELGMTSSDYVSRMAASNTNINMGGLNIQSLNKLLSLSSEGHPTGERDKTITALTVSKSVFTAISEALNDNNLINRFHTLLKKYQVSLPSPNQPQLAADFDYIVGFNKLLEVIQKGTIDVELSDFVKEVYTSIRKTSDIIRGSVFPPKKQFEQIASEAVGKESVDNILVLNYHDEEGAHPNIVNLKDKSSKAELLKQLGLPIKATVFDILSRWYTLHGNSYPYGALHFFGNLYFTPTIYRVDINDRTQHRGEVRLIPKEFEKIAYESRIPFKMMSSQHLTPAKD